MEQTKTGSTDPNRGSETMTSELKGCPVPWCGSTDVVLTVHGTLKIVLCRECKCQTDGQFTDAAAIEQWNTRSSLPNPEGMTEAASECWSGCTDPECPYTHPTAAPDEDAELVERVARAIYDAEPTPPEFPAEVFSYDGQPESTRVLQRKRARAAIAVIAERISSRDDGLREATLGVGDGSGQLFVHGSYEAIKRVQSMIAELGEDGLRSALIEARNMIDAAHDYAHLVPLLRARIDDALSPNPDRQSDRRRG